MATAPGSPTSVLKLIKGIHSLARYIAAANKADNRNININIFTSLLDVDPNC